MFLLEMYCSTPVGRYALHWYGGLVRCAKLFTISSGLQNFFVVDRFCLWHKQLSRALYVSGPVPCTHGFKCSRWVSSWSRTMLESISSTLSGLNQSASEFPTFWEGIIKALPCGRKPSMCKHHHMVNFQLQCRRWKPSLAYSLTLRSPWAVTGEENHVLHNYHYCCNTFILLHFTEPKCRF